MHLYRILGVVIHQQTCSTPEIDSIDKFLCIGRCKVQIEDKKLFYINSFNVCSFMQNHWFFFDDLCVDDSQNFNVGDLMTSLDHPERHGKAKVRLREGEKEKNH